MSRWLSPLMAFCLSFMLMTTFAPMLNLFDRQIDFWALWLGSIVFLALPFIYLELALVKRTKATILNALMALTREADASARWRVVGWMSVAFMPFLAGGMLANAQHVAMQFMHISLSETLIFVGLSVVAFILSFLPRTILVLLSTVTLVTSIILSQIFYVNLAPWHLTAMTLPEWGNAVVLALIATGLGLGIYAQTDLEKKDSTSRLAMPIWCAQIVAIIVFSFFAIQAQASALAVVVMVVFGSALLLQCAKAQLAERKASVVLQYLVWILPCFAWACSAILPALDLTLMLWGLSNCLIYAVFVGWVMKISHLRKAMNLNTEFSYNLWRIAVRVVVPVSIIVAMGGLVWSHL